MGIFAAIVILIVSIIVYFLPALIANHRKKRNVGAITALNFFLGWTFVGWVVALVWAYTVDPQPQQVIYQQVSK
jgi:Na+/H+-dicarboxylate symporter